MPYHFDGLKPAGSRTRDDFDKEITSAVECYRIGQIRSMVILASWSDGDTSISSHVENDEDRRNLLFTAERITDHLRPTDRFHDSQTKK